MDESDGRSSDYGTRLERLIRSTVKRVLGRKWGPLRKASGYANKLIPNEADTTFLEIVFSDFEYRALNLRQCIHCKWATVRGSKSELTECRNPRSPCYGRLSLISEEFGCLFHQAHMCGIIPGIRQPVAKQGDDDGISGDGDGAE